MRVVTTPKERAWSEGLYQRAVEFHGHGGPFMLIGLRMGMLALRALDAEGWFGIRCVARLHWGPPDSCVLDGIQISTGCTTGKHNLDVVEAEGVTAKFEAGDRVLVVGVRDGILAAIREEQTGHGDESEEENLGRLMRRLREMPETELFEVHRG
jgi:formylmethanofuran dehydrogenase subunit E